MVASPVILNRIACLLHVDWIEYSMQILADLFMIIQLCCHSQDVKNYQLYT